MMTRQRRAPLSTMTCSFLLIMCISLFTATAAAQQSDIIYETLSKSELLSIMEEEGYIASDDGEYSILWPIEGNPTYFFFNEDNEYVTMFWAGVESDDTTLHDTNEWNKNNRFVRTYIDDDGDPILEIDLDVEGGVTRDRITKFLKTCRQSYVSWCDDCVE